jgi:site-specific recombinase XerD
MDEQKLGRLECDCALALYRRACEEELMEAEPIDAEKIRAFIVLRVAQKMRWTTISRYLRAFSEYYRDHELADETKSDGFRKWQRALKREMRRKEYADGDVRSCAERE